MLIGTMNHPARDVVAEIEWMAAMGLEFVDLTLEPPCAGSWHVDAAAIRAALERYGQGCEQITELFHALEHRFGIKRQLLFVPRALDFFQFLPRYGS